MVAVANSRVMIKLGMKVMLKYGKGLPSEFGTITGVDEESKSFTVKHDRGGSESDYDMHDYGMLGKAPSQTGYPFNRVVVKGSGAQVVALC